MSEQKTVDELLAQAREFEDLGDYAQAVHFYSRAIDAMGLDDPRRQEALSSIEYLQGMEVPTGGSARVPGRTAEGENAYHGAHHSGTRRGLIAAGVLLFACLELAAMLMLQSRLYPGSVSMLMPSGNSTPSPTGVTNAPGPAAAPGLTITTPEPSPLPGANSKPPSATSTPLLPPTALPILPPAPTVPPNPNLAAKTVFEDIFDKGRLDQGKWTYENQKGSLLEWSHNTMRIYSGAPHDAYVYARTDPFPADGAFSAYFRWRYLRTAACHAAVAVATFAPPSPDTAQPATLGAEVSIWFGYGGVHFSSDQETEDILVPDWATNWHDIVVSYVNSQYVINVDGKPIFTSHPTNARPHTIWFGNPADLGPGKKCEWDTLEIERVRVDHLSEQQGIQSNGPTDRSHNTSTTQPEPTGTTPPAGSPVSPRPGGGGGQRGNGNEDSGRKGKGKGDHILSVPYDLTPP